MKKKFFNKNYLKNNSILEILFILFILFIIIYIFFFMFKNGIYK